METLEHSKSRRLYSWWWDSHISPKNSKWLQENLTDMDGKVKAMIKLIEEDADSFARRAEMFYKKRPELTKLVEEFYRAYRALAERYDHATGELRQAQHTMAKAFPNQLPHVLTDDSPVGTYVPEGEPRTPEMPSPSRSFYYPDDIDKDVSGVSPYPHVIKRHGAYSAENITPSRKGLKQLNEICQTGEGEVAYAKSLDGKARKGLYFPEEEAKGSGYKKLDFSRDFHNQDLSRKEDAQNEIKCLQEALALLSTENQNLKSEKESESERADKAESEVRNLKDNLSRLNSEKEDVTRECQQLIERISSMETELSHTQDEFKKLNDVTVTEAMKFDSAENRCVLFDKANQSLRLDMDDQEQKMKNLQVENSKLWTENWNLTTQVTSESTRANKAESEVQSVKDSLSKLNSETETAVLQYQQSLERISCLEGQFSQKQDDFTKLSGEMVMQATKTNRAEGQCLVLEKEKQSLKLELEHKMKAYQEDCNQLSTANENLKTLVTKELHHAQRAEIEVQSLKSQVSELNYEKESVNAHYQLSVEMTSHLGTQISQTQDDCMKLSGEIVMQATKLNSAEDRCLVLEKEIRSLRLELDILDQKMKVQQEDNNQLSTENESLKSLITKERDHAQKAEIEVQHVKSQVFELNIQKEAANVQYQQSLETVSHLETQVFQTQEDNIKLMDEMVREATKLSNAEQQCLLLIKANQTLKTELDTSEEKIRDSQEENSQLSAVIDNLKIQITSESERAYKAETEVQNLKEKVRDCQEEISELSAVSDDLKIQITSESERAYKAETEVQRLKERVRDSQEEISQLSAVFDNLKIQITSESERAYKAETEVQSLKEKVRDSQEEISRLSAVVDNFKIQITSESGRSHKAETEVQSLKDTLSNLNFEKESCLHQYQQSLEKISYLETQICQTEENIKKLSDDMVLETMKLRLAEEQCLVLEKANQSKILELDTIGKEKKAAEEEVSYHRLEIEKVNTSLEDERQQLIGAQMALLTMEKLHSKSQEELKHLGLEIQCAADKLKDVELRNMGLQEEICNLKDENSSLSKHNLSSAMQIKVLEDEINILREVNGNFEDEIVVYLEEKKLLQQNFDYLKDQKNELEQRHQYLSAEMEVVRLNAESLDVSIKQLQDEHTELNDICKTHEEEKLLLLENLKNMENFSEKNRDMENSLANANVELNKLRETIKALEHSCEALHGEVSTHITEKSVLLSQVEMIAQSTEKLMEENTFLEKSSSVVKLEAEGLRRKLKDLEDSFQALYDQKENLIVERGTLILQVDSMSQSLERMENRHAELEIKHLNLEKENALRVHEVLELEKLLKLENQLHESIIQSSKNQVSTLENEILVLREEIQVREEEVEVEHKIVVGSEIELLVLHSSIRDMNEVILSLSKDCQKHSEASRCAEKLVSRLKEEGIVQMEKMSLLLVHNEKVKESILLLLTALDINKHCGAVDGEKDEVLLEIILGEIEKLLNSISAVWDEVHHLHLEISVIVTLLDQTGLHLNDLTIEKQLLEQELEIRKVEVSVLQCSKQELLERNEQLMQDMQISGHREEEMKFAMGALQWHLSDLQDAQRASQSEINNILDKNQSLSQTIHSLRETKGALEEENSVVIAEALTLDHLYLLFRSFSSERASDYKLLSDDAYRLSEANNNLDQEIRQMNENMGVLEMENIHLKESVACVEDYRNCLVALQFDLQTSHCYCKELTDQVENGNDLLLQKERELSETNEKVQSTQEKNGELSRNLECLNEEIYKARMVREELQNKNFSFSEDIASRNKEIERLGEVNKLLYDKLEILNSEVGALRSREEQLTSRLLKGINEFHQCELEIMTLLKDTQFSAVSAAVFEDKVFELILESEIFAILQREVLNEEIHSRNANAKDLKEKLDLLEGENRGLRAHLDAYLPLVTSLQGSIASLEEQTLSLTRHPASFKQESEENFLGSHQKLDNNSLGGHHTPMVPTGVLELQKLIAKFGELQKVITDTAALLEKERLNHIADLEAARKEIREMKAERSLSHEETRTENDVERGADHKLHQDHSEHSKRKHVQMMKDIQLDQVSSTPYGLNRFGITETDDQMLKLWESAESSCDGQMKRAPRAVLEHDIEAVEEEKSEYPSSELVPEKELSVDRLEVSSGVGQSHQEWSRRVIERLSSDLQRLSILQMSMQELERKMETCEMSDLPKNVEYDTIKAKLKEGEGTVLQLININSKLMKKAEDFPASCDGTSGAQAETERKGRMQISARAQRGSEKIGRLELELQKIQFILLKLEEEHNSEKGKPTERKPKAVLSDYIHGRRNGDKQKKKYFCGCMRSKTDSD